MHRLLALVDEAALDELAERPCDVRLIPRVHRQVVVVPVAEDHQPLELAGHHVDEAAGVVAAGAADLGHRHVALLRSELAIDLQLDRQAVAVVARQVRHVEAGHRARLDDEVLEDLVERRAEVDLAVGVRRAVVEDELRRAAALRANLPVQVHGLPAGDRFRLGRLQVRLHRETCARQIDRVLPLGHMSIQLTLRSSGPPLMPRHCAVRNLLIVARPYNSAMATLDRTAGVRRSTSRCSTTGCAS